jgi:hypothetical protein
VLTFATLTDLTLDAHELHNSDFSALIKLVSLRVNESASFSGTLVALPPSIARLPQLTDLNCGHAVHVAIDNISLCSTLTTLNVCGALEGRQSLRPRRNGRAKCATIVGRVVFRRQYALNLARLRHLILYRGHIHPASSRCMAAHMHSLEKLEVVRFDLDHTCKGFRNLRELAVDRITQPTLRLLAAAIPFLTHLQVLFFFCFPHFPFRHVQYSYNNKFASLADSALDVHSRLFVIGSVHKTASFDGSSTGRTQPRKRVQQVFRRRSGSRQWCYRIVGSPYATHLA